MAGQLDPAAGEAAPGTPTSLGELAALFLRLGFTAFGGPAAHVAMMQEEVVRKRRWLSREAFVDLYGATQLIPGPNSTELAIHIGHARRGMLGLVVAGACFIGPAALIVTAFAWAYVRFGALPQVADLFYGIKPVIIAIIAQALVALAPAVTKSLRGKMLAVAALIGALAGVHELIVLAACAAAFVVLTAASRGRAAPRAFWPALPVMGAALPAAGAPFGLLPLFLTFAKIGSVLFGSGYVLLAFLRSDFVERLHWLTETQLLDAVAVGQFTPGPVFTTASFVGYVLGGVPGAAVATLGIFLPAFVFVALSGPLIPRLRRSVIASAILDGVNVGSLALMAAVTVQLGRAAIVDVATAAIAIASAIVLHLLRPNSAWLVLGGALLGSLARHVLG